MSTFKEDHLPDMLPLFYNRLFPYASFYKWLSYGNPGYFAHREMSFTLLSDIYLRYRSYDSQDEFVNELRELKPIKIDIGAVYASKPKDRRTFTTMQPLERELVFDIDMTDYDEVRTCCTGADICEKCWKFMVITCKIVDAYLREDFSFKHLLWVFSGRRGVHCHVCDESARTLDDYNRASIAEYIQVVKGGGMSSKKVTLYGEKIHSCIRGALKIIKPYFNTILKEQDLLGTNKRLSAFLLLIDDSIRHEIEKVMTAVNTTEERWDAFVECFRSLSNKGAVPKSSRNLVEELILQYSYPRIDINVSKGVNHLLKAPFCVHPKTGKICVPFSPKLIDKFDPMTVPTISLLIDEINAYDKQTVEQETSINMEVDDNKINYSKVKDYKKTSLLKPVAIFDEFLRGLELDTKKKKDRENAMEI